MIIHFPLQNIMRVLYGYVSVRVTDKFKVF